MGSRYYDTNHKRQKTMDEIYGFDCDYAADTEDDDDDYDFDGFEDEDEDIIIRQ